MDDDRWRRVEALFHECLHMTPPQRIDFLDRSCSGDATLRGEVEAVLEASLHTDGFIEKIVEVATERILGSPGLKEG
jgi:hypothetical protein